MTDAVVEFAKWVIQESVFDGCDLDGGIVQEKALELGLLTKTSYDPEKHGEDEYAEPGSDWYVFSNLLNHPAPSPAPEAQLAEKEAENARLRRQEKRERTEAIEHCAVIADMHDHKGDIGKAIRGLGKLPAPESTPAPEQRELSAEDEATFDLAFLRSGRKVEATPPEQTVTEAMVEAVVQAVRPYTMQTLFIDEHRELVRDALKAAQEGK